MATCPHCGTSSRKDFEAISVERVLHAKPLGTWSVAGRQLKTVASGVLRMSCRCGWYIDGFVDGEGFCGWPETQHFPPGDKRSGRPEGESDACPSSFAVAGAVASSDARIGGATLFTYAAYVQTDGDYVKSWKEIRMWCKCCRQRGTVLHAWLWWGGWILGPVCARCKHVGCGRCGPWEGEGDS